MLHRLPASVSRLANLVTRADGTYALYFRPSGAGVQLPQAVFRYDMEESEKEWGEEGGEGVKQSQHHAPQRSQRSKQQKQQSMHLWHWPTKRAKALCRGGGFLKYYETTLLKEIFLGGAVLGGQKKKKSRCAHTSLHSVDDVSSASIDALSSNTVAITITAVVIVMVKCGIFELIRNIGLVFQMYFLIVFSSKFEYNIF